MAHPRRIEPGPGQESVWDYPRPPRVEETTRRIRVIFNEETIVDTTRALRVLETSHPPAYYLPAADFRTDLLTQTSRRTFCEFKGAARYWTLRVGDRIAENVMWDYPDPTPNFQVLKGHFAVYPSRMDVCYINEERVQAQSGDFYGGWITSDIVGPFKGGPGTIGW